SQAWHVSRGVHDRRRTSQRRRVLDGRDGDRMMSVSNVKSKSATVAIERTAESVFAFIDDIWNVGFHMSEQSSMAMMGSQLKLETLSAQPTGLGATYRYSGKVLGLTLDFTESVTGYVPNREKVWHTTGSPRLLIMSSYEMRLTVEPLSPSASRLTISIAYELPAMWFWRCLAILRRVSYARRCLRRMCRDAKRALDVKPPSGLESSSVAEAER